MVTEAFGTLQGRIDGAPDVDRALDDAAFVRAMLDTEAALARALSRAGIVPPESGQVVTRALSELAVDPVDLGHRARSAGNPVVPLVADAVAAVPDAAQVAVHRGATSQDVLDTALMLCAHRARPVILTALGRATEAAARLAGEHRDTPMVARTLGRAAAPTTFGLKVAGWLTALSTAADKLGGCRLDVQLGGAAGTLASYGDRGPDLVPLLAEELGLGEPEVPWHTERSRVRALAGAAAGVVLAAGKVATDVLLMSQDEVGEVAEGSPGGSSAMPHKSNPVASVLLVSAARRVPGLVSAVLGSALHEHERATGSWHAEWAPLRELLHLAGGAAARVADLLTGLQVFPPAMRRNLDAAQPGVMAEAYATARIAELGRAGAQEAARRAVAEHASLGDPLGYLGAAGPLVDRVLAAHEQRTRSHD